MDTNGMPDEEELSELEASLQAAAWVLIGYVSSRKANVLGIYRAEGVGTRVVTQSSATTGGLLAAVEAFERHEAASKANVHDIRGEEHHDG
jgi:hypothetical protein